MSLLEEGVHTIDDIYNLPNGERAELIDGQIYHTAPPNTTHQRISTFLHGTIFSYISSKNGPREVFHALFAVLFQAEDEKNNANYLEPDISIICDKDKLDNKGCRGIPDWTTETVSPSSRQMGCYKKLALYQGMGVRECWTIDPAREAVMAYDLANETLPIIYRSADSAKVNIHEGFSIDFSQFRLRYHPHCSRVALALLLFIPLSFCRPNKPLSHVVVFHVTLKGVPCPGAHRVIHAALDKSSIILEPQCIPSPIL